MKVSVYNGAGQADYLYGLVSGLSSAPIDEIEILDINLAAPLFREFPNTRFHDVYHYQKKGTPRFRKALNIARFYLLQTKHLLTRKRRIVHFQWLDRYFFIDRVILPLIARIRGHKVILTVHNVNARKRDNKDTRFNRLTLSTLYRLCNHLIVHTEKSKAELMSQFGIKESKISVVQHGMNNKVVTTGMAKELAREKLKIAKDRKVALFFGNIDYYKGLDLLADSLSYINGGLKNEITLLIAGNYKSKEYYEKLNKQLSADSLKDKVIANIRFIQDEEVENYFMAADCIVLPYREIYQSGVLFMAYNFGLPTIATRVGNFENDIIHGQTGFLTDNIDPLSIAETLQQYFGSEMYKKLPETRTWIKEWSHDKYSWEKIGKHTCDIYLKVLQNEK